MSSQRVDEIATETKKRGRPSKAAAAVAGAAAAPAAGGGSAPNHNKFYKAVDEALALGFRVKASFKVQVPEDYEDAADAVKKVTPFEFTVQANDGGNAFVRGLYRALNPMRLTALERELGNATQSLTQHIAGLEAAAEAEQEADELRAKAARRAGEAFVRRSAGAAAAVKRAPARELDANEELD
jgi:hypothetical protein